MGISNDYNTPPIGSKNDTTQQPDQKTPNKELNDRVSTTRERIFNKTPKLEENLPSVRSSFDSSASNTILNVFKRVLSSLSSDTSRSSSHEVSHPPSHSFRERLRRRLLGETSLTDHKESIENAHLLKENFKSKINNYSVKVSENTFITSDSTKATDSRLSSSLERIDSSKAEENQKSIETKLKTYLDDNALNELYRGTSETTVAREAFIDFLFNQKISQASAIDKDPIKITKLLGRHGEKLYREAVKEEHNSRQFRSAVCLACSKKAGNEKRDPEIILVVGPSASGKSSAINAVTEELFPANPSTSDAPPLGEVNATASLPKDSEESSPQNKLIEIDGSVERAFGQTASMLLDFSKQQGYQGVVGLHEHNSLFNTSKVTSIKETIYEAIKKNETKDISMIIPLTFAAQGATRENRSSKALMLISGGVDKYFKLAETMQAKITLVEVVGEDSPNDFQNSVAKMGTGRAWEAMGKKVSPMDPNSQKPPSSESKEYNSKYFTAGLAGSKAAAQTFIELAANKKDLNPKHFVITNNLVTLIQDEKSRLWRKVNNVAEAEGNSTVLIKRPLLEIWEHFLNEKAIDSIGLQDVSAYCNKRLINLTDDQKKEFIKFFTQNDLKGFSTYCYDNKIGQDVLIKKAPSPLHEQVKS